LLWHATPEVGIELSGATILPGLINTHVHNAYNERNLRLWAEQGVTTVRDLGERLGFPYFSTRDRLRADPKNAWLISAGPSSQCPGATPSLATTFPR
jgi:predicted amidohydrolase YtcJ